MSDLTIRCPKCKNDIKLTEAMAGPLIAAARQDFDRQLKEVQQAVTAREEAVAAAQARLKEKVDAGVREQLVRRVEEERAKINSAASDVIDQERRKATEARQEVEAMNTKLAEAQRAQADALRREREYNERLRELDLTVAKRVTEEAIRLRSSIATELETENRLAVAEKEHVIAQMATQIDDLRRKAEQGSQQLQGEVQELELERELAAAFPTDTIEPIGKGIHGADCQHYVVTLGGKVGTILWESKRTKNWGPDWLAKLRDDQRDCRADVAVIVSRALPEGLKTFGLVEGIWITAPLYAVPLATALRATITGIAAFRSSSTGQATKAELLYQYLTGTGFRHRVEAMVERFTEMREDLDRERKFTTKQLAKREEQINQAIATMTGMYGDLQGIAGKSVPELEGLSLEGGDA